MPSDKPRITLRIEPEDMEYLEKWAKEEFLTVPQMARIIVKRAIAARRKNEYSPSSDATGSKGRGKKGGEE
ncbi:hypothetical protein [Allocoleopsis sp.]|uniref:hypothetical protein n=1 Tax=Allocoleopsis sp. TaxID=3088169 RepID=UPI002FD409B0